MPQQGPLQPQRTLKMNEWQSILPMPMLCPVAENTGLEEAE